MILVFIISRYCLYFIQLRATRPDNLPLVNQTIRIGTAEKFVNFLKVDKASRRKLYNTDANGFIRFTLKISDEIYSINIFVSIFSIKIISYTVVLVVGKK